MTTPTVAAESPASGARRASAGARLFGEEPLEPLSRRLLQGAGFLSLLLIAVVANSFLNSEVSPLNPMAVAAERTQGEPGARFTMKATYTSSALPQPMVAHGRGAYNAETGLSKMTMEMNVPSVGPMSFEAVGNDVDVYMRGSAISEELPDGKEWLKMQPTLGHSQEELMVGSDAGDSLQILGAVGDGVTELGQEKVRGVPTSRYRAAVELDDVVELYRSEGKDDLADDYEQVAAVITSPLTIEASIDARDIVRRFRMVMTIPTEPGQPALTMDMRMDLFGFGARPEVQLPDSSKVFDAS